jgi:hypothetical protein
LVGSRDHRTQIWKGAIQGPFHQSLVQIGPVASEELIKMWKVNGRTDGRTDIFSSPDPKGHVSYCHHWASVVCHPSSVRPSVRPLTFHILINSSEATGPIWTKLWWNGPWMAPFILKGTHPGTIPARFGLIWFCGFRGEDLNVIFYQNMPN